MKVKKILSYIFFSCIFLVNFYLNSNNFILKVNGQKIKKEEFMLYLYEQKKYFEETGGLDIWQTHFDSFNAKDVAKNNAISASIFIKNVSSKAEFLGIKLPEEELNSIKEYAKKLQKEALKVYPNSNLSLKICQKYIKENALEFKIFEYITNGYEINEQEFLKFYNKNLNEYKETYKKITLDYIEITKDSFNNTDIILNDIFSKVTKESNFEDFKNENINVKLNITLNNNDFEPYIYDTICKLEEGSISNIIEGYKSFYIFKIKNIEDYTENEIKDILIEEYIQIKKNEIYSAQIKSWENNLSVEKNEKAINKIDILNG